MRFTLGARTHAEEALVGVAPHRQHVIGAGKYRQLTNRHLVAHQFDDLHDDEQRVAILLDLGPLVAAQRIFHRQFVQAEFFLHQRDVGSVWVAQRDPDKGVIQLDVVADILDRDIGQLFAFLVGDAIDQH